MKKRKKSDVVIILKRKGKPRGIPFKKGNKLGRKFPPGVSGRLWARNPKNIDSTPTGTATRQILNARYPGDPEGRTFAQVITELYALKAIVDEDQGAAEFIVDRAEGKPNQPVSNDQGDAFQILIASMNAKADKVGPPEGQESKKKKKG